MSGRGTWSWINLFNHCVAQNCEKEQIHVRIVYHFWNSLTRFITVACLADILITPCYHILVPIRVGRAWPTKKRQGQGHACHGQTRGTPNSGVDSHHTSQNNVGIYIKYGLLQSKALIQNFFWNVTQFLKFTRSM